MLYLLSTAHSACAHSFTCSLHNRKLVSRMVAMSFHRAVALHLVFLHSLVLINTCSELDSVVGLSGTHATLTMAGLCIPSLVRHFLRLNEHVEKSLLGRKSPKDSNFVMHLLLRGPQHVRFFCERSKLQQISWK